MAIERTLTIEQGIASAAGGSDRNDSQDTCVDELLNENRRLREIVIYLSGIIIRDAVNRK